MSLPPDSDFSPPKTPGNLYDTARLANIAAAVRELDHPTQIGPYTILELIGEGGMGSVYRAEQRSPIQRIVAIKLIKLGMDTREVISRFQSERQVLAMMDHPNVARVIDAGATSGGSPYFVMEYVRGEPITAFADRQRLNIRQRLELFTQACEAVQHAHQKAIIHRDLKPSNILVALDGETPRVKVIDFGVAKAIDSQNARKTLFTHSGKLLGTPEYMAPEQADTALADDIDTRGDVYSLGVILYELLSGALPFDASSLRSAGYDEIHRMIRETDPPRLSTRLSRMGEDAKQVALLRQTPLDALQRELKRELEWIPLKAMRKDRAERYASATELADDIQNYLANRPLRAGPESNAYRTKKFLRRNRGPVAAAIIVLLVLVAGVIGTTWQAIRARQQSALAAKQRDVAQRERDNAEAVVQFFTKEVIGAADPAETHGRAVTVQEAVDKAAAKIDKSLVDRPLIDASVRLSISDTYRALGKYDLALPYAKRAYEIRRDQLGEDDFPTVIALSRMANILIYLQRPTEAEPLVRQIAVTTARLKGPDDLETMAAENNVGNVIQMLGRFSEAAPIFRKHYEVLRRVEGDDEFDTIAAGVNYAAILLKLGRLAEAEPLSRDAYDRCVRKYGTDDPDTLEFGHLYAVILGELGRHTDSATLGKQIWDARRRVLGDDNPDTIATAKDYAAELPYVGRGDEGLALLKQMMQRNQAKNPTAQPTLDSMQLYAHALSAQNRHEESAAVYQDTLEKRRKLLGNDHPETLVTQINYAAELSTLGRDADAEPIAREAVELLTQRVGADHRSTLIAKQQLALVLLKLNRPAEAEPFARQSASGLKKLLGDQHAETRRAGQALFKVLIAEDRPADAAQVRSEYGLPSATQPSGLQSASQPS